MDSSNIHIGKRLKEIQSYKGISSRKMALAIGVDPSQLLKIEKGKMGLTAEQAKEVSSVYGISIDWLYNGEGNMLSSVKASDLITFPDQPELTNEYLYRIVIETKDQMLQTKSEVIKASSDVASLKNEMKVSFERLQNLLGGISDSQMLVSKFLVRQIAALTKQAPGVVLTELDKILNEGQKL